MRLITPETLKPLLNAKQEYAFLDVREQGQYGEGHPFFCVPFAYSQLEYLAEQLLPCKRTQIVLLDDGDDVALRAALVLEGEGYDNVSVLDGGAPGWAAAGYTLYKGVNVMSKTYGELLEHVADTPRLTATEFKALLEKNPDVITLDGRSPAEYKKMTIPGALCCPNAELGYRIDELVRDSATTIVINCAGRTRSILGVEGLRVLDIPNPIFALENGTQGWKLAGYELAHGESPQVLPVPSADREPALRDQATKLIASADLRTISTDTAAEWLDDDRRTTYLLDVRTQSEFEQSHWPGARHAPGGQLVQATDQYVAVRNARIVLSDDNHLRAATTAIRLRDMGHDVHLLDADASTGTAGEIPGNDDANTSVDTVDFPGVDDLRDRTLLDASPGMDYRDAHIDKALWVTRARIDRMNLKQDEALLVTGQDPIVLEGVVRELATLGFTRVKSCPGNPATWTSAGHNVIETPDLPTEADCIDYLFFVHDRHDGNMDAARRYLEWEVGLVAQMDEQERSALTPHARFE